MAFGISLGDLLGDDRKLAATKYAGQTPATDTARAARRAGHHRSAAKADAKGAAWEAKERQKDRWWR